MRARILSTKLRCRKPRFDFETFDDASRLRKAYAEKNWTVSEAFKLNSIKKNQMNLFELQKKINLGSEKFFFRLIYFNLEHILCCLTRIFRYDCRKRNYPTMESKKSETLLVFF